MKSTIVIYEHEHESGKAAAKHIAYHLGAQTTCTRHVEAPIVDNVDNFVLCVSTWGEEGIPDEWFLALTALGKHDLKDKVFAIFVDNSEPVDVDAIYNILQQMKARVVKVSANSIDEWICAISPSL